MAKDTVRSFVDGHELQVVRTRDAQGVESRAAVCCITCERNGVTSGFACMKIAAWNKQEHATYNGIRDVDGTLLYADMPSGVAPVADDVHASVPLDVTFLTGDERRFFAYMADQRFRTVSEMDPAKREAARLRWQEVAQWFVPDWDGNYRG